MAVVGSAEVIVRAITSKVKQDIEKAFRDARASIRKEGQEAGKEYADGFTQSINNAGFGDSFKNALDNSGVNEAAQEAGRKAGESFNNSLEESSSDIDLGSSMANSMTQSAEDAARRASDSAGDELEAGMRGAGGRGGRGFRDGFLNSGFADAAVAASSRFTSLLAMSNIMGPAIGGLVGALSSLVSGLFAMASAAGQAAGALAVLPGAMMVAAQAGGALKLAFSGVGDALQAGIKLQDASNSSNAASAASTYAVVDAQKALQRARQGAADAAFDAAQRVRLAEAGVRSAQQEVLSVQRQLNDARREAAESLQQLAFSAEGAALSEERAALNLEEARERMIAAQDLPADDRTRREAELSYKEAELAFRQAKDRNSDLAKEQKKASKAGIKGSDEVVAARQKINDANEKLANAERQLADARRAQSRQQRDSAQAIADAAERLRRAQEEANKAIGGGSKEAEAYQAALDKLGKPAADFVEYLVSLQDEMKGLKVAAGENLFPGLEAGLRPIVDNLFPVLETQLRDTGGLLGDMAEQIGNTISKGEGLTRIREIMKNNNDILGEFTKKGENGKSAVENLVIVAERLAQAIQPITRRFARWIATLTGTAEAATDSKKEMDGLRDFFERAGDTAAQLGDIFGNLFEALGILGDAAQPAGQSLLDSFEGATEKLVEFLDEMNRSGELGEFFEGAADNLKSIGKLANAIGKEFLSLGDNEGVGKFAESLIPAVEIFGDIGDKMTESAPKVGELATEVAELIDALTDSGAMDKFLDNMTKVVDVIGDVLKSDASQKMLGVAASIAAITRVASFVLKPIKFMFKAIVGGPIAAIRALGKFKNFLTRLPSAWRTLRNGGGLRAAFQAMKGGSDSAKRALERQMVTDKQKVKTLKRLEIQARRTATQLQAVKTAGAPAAAGAAAAGTKGAKGAKGSAGLAAGAASAGAVTPGAVKGAEAVGKATDDVGKKAAKTGGKLGRMGSITGKIAKGPFKLLGGAFKLLGRGMMAVLGPIGLVILIGYGLVKFFTALYKKSPEFRKFVDAIVEKLKAMGDWFKMIFNKYIVPAMNRFFGWLNDNMPAIKGFFQDLWEKIKVVGGWIKGAFKAMAAKFSETKEDIKRDIDRVKDLWNTLREKISNFVQAVKDKWTEFKESFGRLKDNIKGVIENIKGFWDDLREKIGNFVGGIKDKWGDFVDGINNLKDRISEKVEKIKDFFRGIPDAVKEAFENLGDKAKGGINAFITMINEKLIAKINKIPGIEIPDIPTIGMAAGGRVTGRGGPKEDNQLRALSVGEYVIRTDAARKLGYQLLAYLNKYGRIPGLASGGTVSATNGGLLALIGEGGKSERVEPLDSSGLSARDRAIIGMMLEQFQGGDTWNIHPAPGMSEAELAALVRRDVRFSRRRGA